MKLCKMIEIYLKYDNMHTIRTINVFICINNHVNSCINSMLSRRNSHGGNTEIASDLRPHLLLLQMASDWTRGV